MRDSRNSASAISQLRSWPSSKSPSDIAWGSNLHRWHLLELPRLPEGRTPTRRNTYLVANTSRSMTCVACQGQDMSTFVSTRQLKLYRCAVCGSLTALPRPSEDSLAAYHDTAAYFDHPYFERRRRDVERTDARCRD